MGPRFPDRIYDVAHLAPVTWRPSRGRLRRSWVTCVTPVRLPMGDPSEFRLAARVRQRVEPGVMASMFRDAEASIGDGAGGRKRAAEPDGPTVEIMLGRGRAWVALERRTTFRTIDRLEEARRRAMPDDAELDADELARYLADPASDTCIETLLDAAVAGSPLAPMHHYGSVRVAGGGPLDLDVVRRIVSDGRDEASRAVVEWVDGNFAIVADRLLVATPGPWVTRPRRGEPEVMLWPEMARKGFWSQMVETAVEDPAAARLAGIELLEPLPDGMAAYIDALYRDIPRYLEGVRDRIDIVARRDAYGLADPDWEAFKQERAALGGCPDFARLVERSGMGMLDASDAACLRRSMARIVGIWNRLPDDVQGPVPFDEDLFSRAIALAERGSGLAVETPDPEDRAALNGPF